MTEWTEAQLKDWMKDSSERRFFYFYTPLCGTCKWTERMLQVILTLDPQLPIVKCNVNFCRQTAIEWQIESVPCIVGFGTDGGMRKRYKMQAVDDLHRWFQQINDNGRESS
ncbi:thioredoxin family protein [Paenibacillus piri]|uniref:Thioredoxin n=1 Tax=Paenibacillus piri TaxID=2547395 RepID=A0A4R5KUJ6_9BACL|nr:thioredoxin family protein [Paenibacillus piri]TDF99603.1 thioredoxin [Paenibacillus piri]